VSIRLRLMVATVALTALGLAGGAIATYQLVQSFLVERLDEDIEDARFEVLGHLTREGGPPDGRPRGPFVPVERDTYAELRGVDGSVIHRVGFEEDESGEVVAPVRLGPGAVAPVGRPFTAHGIDGRPDYRVHIAPVGPRGESLLIAQPMSEVEQTLDRLILIEAGVSGFVLVFVAGLVYVAVRVGFRPLEHVIATADAIAAGDLERRVTPSGGRTEVGHLAAAFNAMLGTIHESLRQREASEARLRSFVADASHELRTPLTSLKGYAEMLERRAITPEDRIQAAVRIGEASDRMTRLVSDMLVLARLDEEPAVQMERVELGDVVRVAVAEARAIEPEMQLAVLATDDAPIAVMGDRDHLTRAVSNLLANVRMHTSPGTRAEISVYASGGTAVIAVRDDGPGIPVEVQEQLFDRFFRADKSRSRARGGAGLGLSIVASIAERHGGSVSVESEPGDGATFRLALPIAPAE